MATIRGNGPVVKPTHHVKLRVAACFPFTGIRHIDPTTIALSLRAVFPVQILGKPTREQLEGFPTWIQTLLSAYAIELDGIYMFVCLDL